MRAKQSWLSIILVMNFSLYWLVGFLDQKLTLLDQPMCRRLNFEIEPCKGWVQDFKLIIKQQWLLGVGNDEPIVRNGYEKEDLKI